MGRTVFHILPTNSDLASAEAYLLTEDNKESRLKDALKDGGKLIIIDHSAAKGTGIDAANTLHRIDEEFTIRQFESIGFKLQSSSDFLRNPKDNPSLLIWDDKVYQKTDRFILLFTKESSNIELLE